MSSFKDITNRFSVSTQLTPKDIETAAQEGFTAIICNRPDGEDSGQMSAADIEAACTANNLTFTHIPVSGGVSADQIDAMNEAIQAADGSVLAYCRSGTRSTNLWAMAQAKNGANAQGLVTAAGGAGYDLSGLIPMLRSLSQDN